MSDSPLPTADPISKNWSMNDLLVLTKFRLSALVIVSTFVAFWLRAGTSLDGWLLFHTLLGSSLAAFGAAVFNQLMEIEPDSRMTRTADRPLPSGRISPSAAFAIGWLLSAFALIHLMAKVNFEAAALTALTLATYLFIYTPLKRQSPTNTLVGAVSGALPPLIGWAGAAGKLPGDEAYVRWELLLEPGAIYLFILLFLWQLPHFLAINWMYRDEYRRGGFIMLANDDEAGVRTSKHALAYSIATLLLMFYPVFMGLVITWIFLPLALALAGWLCKLALDFQKNPERPTARKLFLCTLIYLPAIFLITSLAWKRA
ncbi:protoheme IX farnesyltransferase [Prosthecobacter fusiformis]|uniref:Protoheme IX farnesyltransferase n=1 Tax=Prosthecobacter fusiformis TaxID=48464 RepID=A0A4R7SS36_9BACT|nr:heme o synthase [Prosthecobacter fusiformis]TDU80988.1 protoheme IX farnesyltransferase [Prosthecobacter fusiformis]